MSARPLFSELIWDFALSLVRGDAVGVILFTNLDDRYFRHA
jgi:hypothetical protein